MLNDPRTVVPPINGEVLLPFRLVRVVAKDVKGARAAKVVIIGRHVFLARIVTGVRRVSIADPDTIVVPPRPSLR